MRLCPWFGWFHKKVPATTRCPLYNMSAIDRFDCIYLLMLFKYRKDKNQKCVINYFSYFVSSCAVRNVVFNIFFSLKCSELRCKQLRTHFFFFPNIFWIICLWLFSGKTRFKNSSKCCNKTRITHYPTNIYLLKVNNRNSRKRCEICSKLTIKTRERRRRRSGVFIVNFEHVSHLFLLFLLLTLNK